MTSLTAHLTDSGDHGRLGFHPGCPACRQQRLFGSLSSEAVISRRAQAALASGVLALSAAGPSAALAQEPDQQAEGAPGAQQATGEGDPGANLLVEAPAEDPDADRTLPLADPSDSELKEDVPVETEPIEAPSPPAVPGSEAEARPDPKPTSDPLQPETVPRPTAPGSPTESPGLVDSPPEATAPEPAPLTDEPTPGALHPEQTAETGPRDHSAPETSFAETTPAAPIAPQATAAPGPAAETTLTSVSSAPAPNAKPATSRGGRFLVVQPGDSLWSIAKRLVGPDASPARIAREVNRLWQLNSDQIGTGSPDLLLVGTKLELR